jgi:nitroreductase
VLRVSLFVLALSTNAFAQSESAEVEARSLAWRGLDLEKHGQCAEAVPLFRRAYNLVPTPTLAVFEGRCRERMHQLLEAEARYEAAASFTPAPGAPAALGRAVDEAKRRLVTLKGKIPRITITNRPANVSVWLDGRAVSGNSFAVNPGTHQLAWGDRSRHKTITVAEGREERVKLDEGTSMRDVGTYAALGIGALGIGTGIVTGFWAADKKSDLNDECKGDVCPASSRGTLDEYRSLRSVSMWSYVVGTVSLGVGGVLLVTKPSAGESAIVASGTF